MNHPTRARLRLVTPFALALALPAVALSTTARADETSAATSSVHSAGAPVFVGAKLDSIGDVQARARGVAGSAHGVDAPTSSAKVATVQTARRRTSRSAGASETGELLAHHHDELMACLPASPDPNGVVLVKAQVAENGHAVSAGVTSFNGVASSAASCLATVASKVTFATHGPRAALVPLRLSVGEIVKPVTPANTAAAPASNASH
jgi:hypothetical protein